MRLRFAAMAIALVAVLVVIEWAINFLQIDRCLDRGSRWDYDAQRCEQTAPGPAFVSPQP